MKPQAQLNLTTSVENAISDDAKYGIMTSLSLTRQQDGEDPSPVLRGRDDLRVALKVSISYRKLHIVATPADTNRPSSRHLMKASIRRYQREY